MIIAYASPKGGVGKSTAAINTVVELYDRGLHPKYVDAEKYGPNAKVVSKVESHIPTYNAMNPDEIDNAIQDKPGETDCVIMDLPKSDADVLFALCEGANCLIIPMVTSQKDVTQLKPFLKLVKAQQLRSGGMPEAALLFTFTRIRSRSARAYRRALQPLGFPIATTQIRQLDDYMENDCVMRDPKLNALDAATDIRRMIDELITPKLSLTKEAVHG